MNEDTDVNEAISTEGVMDPQEGKLLNDLYEAEKVINGAGFVELVQSERDLRQKMYSAKQALGANLKKQGDMVSRRKEARDALKDFYTHQALKGRPASAFASANVPQEDVHEAVKKLADANPVFDTPDEGPRPDKSPNVEGYLSRGVSEAVAENAAHPEAVKTVIGSSSEVTDEDVAEARVQAEREARAAQSQTSFLRPPPG